MEKINVKSNKVTSRHLLNKLTDKSNTVLGVRVSGFSKPKDISFNPKIELDTRSKELTMNLEMRVTQDTWEDELEDYLDRLSSTGVMIAYTEQVEPLTSARLLAGEPSSIESSSVMVPTAIGFINPNVTYQYFTLVGKEKVYLYTIEEEFEEGKFTLELLVKEKAYDGETLLGLFSMQDKLTKKEVTTLITLLEYDPIIPLSIGGAYIKSGKTTFNIYNTLIEGLILTREEGSIAVVGDISIGIIEENDIDFAVVNKVDKVSKEIVINLKSRGFMKIFI